MSEKQSLEGFLAGIKSLSRGSIPCSRLLRIAFSIIRMSWSSVMLSDSRVLSRTGMLVSLISLLSNDVSSLCFTSDQFGELMEEERFDYEGLLSRNLPEVSEERDADGGWHPSRPRSRRPGAWRGRAGAAGFPRPARTGWRSGSCLPYASVRNAYGRHAAGDARPRTRKERKPS